MANISLNSNTHATTVTSNTLSLTEFIGVPLWNLQHAI